jgi:prepilin-type processing-associated H-X9-DG protein
MADGGRPKLNLIVNALDAVQVIALFADGHAAIQPAMMSDDVSKDRGCQLGG